MCRQATIEEINQICPGASLLFLSDNGKLAISIIENKAFAHDANCFGNEASEFVEMYLQCRKVLKGMGFDTVWWTVRADQPKMLDLIEKGRASIVEVLVSMPI